MAFLHAEVALTVLEALPDYLEALEDAVGAERGPLTVSITVAEMDDRTDPNHGHFEQRKELRETLVHLKGSILQKALHSPAATKGVGAWLCCHDVLATIYHPGTDGFLWDWLWQLEHIMKHNSVENYMTSVNGALI